jgi:sulfopyruvate decarboxylase subunit beta
VGRLTRLDALTAVYPRLDDCVVVTIMGAVAAELQSIGHRPNFFYLQHAMGLASSMGLGLALCRPERQVVVFDGDGSVLMNLGGLTTLARYRPRNLVHVVFDNESLLSVGGFPTATATGADLDGIAHASGIPVTATVRECDEFQRRQRPCGDRLGGRRAADRNRSHRRRVHACVRRCDRRAGPHDDRCESRGGRSLEVRDRSVAPREPLPVSTVSRWTINTASERKGREGRKGHKQH